MLGLIPHAIYVSPMFDNNFLVSFADETFTPRLSKSLQELVEEIEITIESITKWLKKSGLVVNNAKTELCLF